MGNMGKKGKEKKELSSQLKEYFKYLDALTAANCSELWDCYRCTAAKLNCAWVPQFAGGDEFDGQCVVQKAIRFFKAAMLRGKPGLPGGNAFTKQAECGKQYDRPAFSSITTIAVAKGI